VGGISDSAALRAIAEIEQWVKLTSGSNNTISATRAIFKDSINSCTDGTDTRIFIRLPISQTSSEEFTFVSTGFGSLKRAVEHISEDFERYLLASLIEELNRLFPLSLASDFVCERFLDDRSSVKP
jgi:hypothetical protein